MPGVSGEANVMAPARPGCRTGGRAKLPGVVPWAVDEGFGPRGGSWYERSVVTVGISISLGLNLWA